MAKSKRKRINWAVVGTLIAQGLTVSAVAEKVGTTAKSLAPLLSRKGILVSQVRKQTAVNLSPDVVTDLSMRVANQASELLKQDYGDILSKHAKSLAKVPAKANLKHLKQVGEALEPFARVAKIVHGWNADDSNKTSVNVHLMANIEPMEEPIDVQASVTSDEPPKV